MALDGIQIRPTTVRGPKRSTRVRKTQGVSELGSVSSVDNSNDVSPVSILSAHLAGGAASEINASLDTVINSVQNITSSGADISSINGFLGDAKQAAEQAMHYEDPRARRHIGMQYNSFLRQAFSYVHSRTANSLNLLNDKRSLHVEIGSGDTGSVLQVDGMRLGEIFGRGPTKMITMKDASGAEASYEQFYAYIMETEDDLIGLRMHYPDIPLLPGDFRVDFGANNYQGTLANVAQEVDAFRSMLAAHFSRLESSAKIINERESFTYELNHKLKLPDFRPDTSKPDYSKIKGELGSEPVVLLSDASLRALHALLIA